MKFQSQQIKEYSSLHETQLISKLSANPSKYQCTFEDQSPWEPLDITKNVRMKLHFLSSNHRASNSSIKAD